MEKVKLGQVTAPVGIRGEIRVYPYLEQTRFSDIKKLSVEGLGDRKIEKLRADKNLLVIKLEGVADRNAAEMLRGRYLYLAEGEKLDLGEDTYLVDDLRGSEVIDESGRVIGKLKDVLSRPVQDLYEIETAEGKTFLLPAVKAFVLGVDPAVKKITVRLPEGIDQL